MKSQEVDSRIGRERKGGMRILKNGREKNWRGSELARKRHH